MNYIFMHDSTLFHIRNVENVGIALKYIYRKSPPTQLYSYSNQDKIEFNIDEYFLMYMFGERHDVKHEIYC